jgi:hypothetical protein
MKILPVLAAAAILPLLPGIKHADWKKVFEQAGARPETAPWNMAAYLCGGLDSGPGPLGSGPEPVPAMPVGENP